MRARQAEACRGGGQDVLTLNTNIAESIPGQDDDILHVHEALEDLAQLEPRLAQVVEMRYFAGLSEPEIAAALGVTDRTVQRDWQKARIFLADAPGSADAAMTLDPKAVPAGCSSAPCWTSCSTWTRCPRRPPGRAARARRGRG